MKQHTAPCSDCPWRRKSIPGWLGEEPLQVWLARAHGEYIVQCHTKSKCQCAGMAIYRANVCKTPRFKEILQLPPDTKFVFASSAEFERHHTRKTVGKQDGRSDQTKQNAAESGKSV